MGRFRGPDRHVASGGHTTRRIRVPVGPQQLVNGHAYLDSAVICNLDRRDRWSEVPRYLALAFAERVEETRPHGGWVSQHTNPVCPVRFRGIEEAGAANRRRRRRERWFDTINMCDVTHCRREVGYCDCSGLPCPTRLTAPLRMTAPLQSLRDRRQTIDGAGYPVSRPGRPRKRRDADGARYPTVPLSRSRRRRNWPERSGSLDGPDWIDCNGPDGPDGPDGLEGPDPPVPGRPTLADFMPCRPSGAVSRPATDPACGCAVT
jgi:hypothetical protein